MVTSSVDTIGRGRALLEHGIAAVDYSSAGMLFVHGDETMDFLHRISTNDLMSCVPGMVFHTVLVSEKAKIVDAVIGMRVDQGVLLMTGPERAPLVKSWLERFIIMEDITVHDVSRQYACALVLGDIDHLTTALQPGATFVQPVPQHATFVHFTFFSLPAVLLMATDVEDLKTTLDALSVPLVMQQAYDEFRISRGIPFAGKEITDAVNPLEAGLKRIVSFTKGCYVGQEVVARLETYKKVQRLLCRVTLTPSPVPFESTEIIGEHGSDGYITTIGSVEGTDGSCTALAIIRSPETGARLTMNDGAVEVRVDTIFD